MVALALTTSCASAAQPKGQDDTVDYALIMTGECAYDHLRQAAFSDRTITVPDRKQVYDFAARLLSANNSDIDRACIQTVQAIIGIDHAINGLGR